MDSFSDMFEDEQVIDAPPTWTRTRSDTGVIEFTDTFRTLKVWSGEGCWKALKAKVQAGKTPTDIFTDMYNKFAEMPQDEMSRAWMMECEQVFEKTYNDYKTQIAALIVESADKLLSAVPPETPPKPKRLFTRRT